MSAVYTLDQRYDGEPKLYVLSVIGNVFPEVNVPLTFKPPVILPPVIGTTLDRDVEFKPTTSTMEFAIAGRLNTTLVPELILTSVPFNNLAPFKNTSTKPALYPPVIVNDV